MGRATECRVPSGSSLHLDDATVRSMIHGTVSPLGSGTHICVLALLPQDPVWGTPCSPLKADIYRVCMTL